MNIFDGADIYHTSFFLRIIVVPTPTHSLSDISSNPCMKEDNPIKTTTLIS